ncbi:hypothetical protein DRE_03948 [Drechslerella stenobrocha 248]|uniref:Uncharacterized protein n=1 Tax=Drechslerella stenobrocha 248 TaxID=1043628 RepID=W7I3D2_9PEZI|nr:hypothetical protein DRE_03948 [Drechslerella stenobrocha 248]
MNTPTLVIDTSHSLENIKELDLDHDSKMTLDSPLVAPSRVQKPFISPPHSPLPCDSPPGDASPHNSPHLLSRSSTGRRTPSLTFTSPQARKRGFVRPQGTEFSKSARSRESVMALGSIAHVQYFFAKTGLLDGKGGGFKRKGSNDSEFGGSEDLQMDSQLIDSTYSSLRSSPDLILPADQFSKSPIDDNEDVEIDPTAILPPTYSTYKPKTHIVPPPPDRESLRDDLKEALDDCRRVWVDAANIGFAKAPAANSASGLGISDANLEDEGIGGEKDELPIPGLKDMLLHTILRGTTFAIRAAKEYYYAADMTVLAKITTEKKIREEFLTVLDVLKRISIRQTGILAEEKDIVIRWVDGVEKILAKELRIEDEGRRKGQVWVEGSWEGREWDRLHLFLNYFDSYDDNNSGSPLPEHDPKAPASESPLLKLLRTGDRLINIHNAIVRRSRRPFGQIPQFHTDFNKPYRLAENLRYWLKAAEIRWGTKIELNVMGVAMGTEEGMQSFEQAVYKWCDRVLGEVIAEWEEDRALLQMPATERKERRRSRRFGSPPSPALGSS